MKKQTTNLFAELGEVHVRTLTTLVRETLSLDYKPTKQKVFTAAELWNIQRQKKVVAGRRFSF